jgi:hypothetical protein
LAGLQAERLPRCIGALLCGVELVAELDAAMLLKGVSNRALAVLVIVAILTVLPDQSPICVEDGRVDVNLVLTLTSNKVYQCN